VVSQRVASDLEPTHAPSRKGSASAKFVYAAWTAGPWYQNGWPPWRLSRVLEAGRAPAGRQLWDSAHLDAGRPGRGAGLAYAASMGAGARRETAAAHTISALSLTLRPARGREGQRATNLQNRSGGATPSACETGFGSDDGYALCG
jgi:hypothetical protein